MGDGDKKILSGLQQKKVFKVIVLGDSGVGKTCLTYRFCSGQFLDKPEATIGVDFRERIIHISNEEIKVIFMFILVNSSGKTCCIKVL